MLNQRLATLHELNRINNFNLVRLLAALGVIALHTFDTPLTRFLYGFFPGVPVFFIISGFLVCGSFMRTPHIIPYLKARFLRIWPALMLSTVITTGLMAIFGYFSWTWIRNQVLVYTLQRTPKEVLDFVPGMPNGPTWTIMVEAQFYLMVPLILWAYAKGKVNRQLTLLLIVTLMGASFGSHYINDLGPNTVHSIGYGPIHHFWFFGFGMLAWLEWQRIRPWIEGMALPWLAFHIELVLALQFAFNANQLGDLPLSHVTNLMLGFTLTPFVLALAFTLPKISNKMLGDTDISYGVYLFHSPFGTLIHRLGYTSTLGALLTLVLTIGTAILSWILVEKPVLSLKHKKQNLVS